MKGCPYRTGMRMHSASPALTTSSAVSISFPVLAEVSWNTVLTQRKGKGGDPTMLTGRLLSR